jgi:hypothetical protein
MLHWLSVDQAYELSSSVSRWVQLAYPSLSRTTVRTRARITATRYRWSGILFNF